MARNAARRWLPLNALRAFDAAARRSSFAGAAEELGVTPSAISQQIRSLEKRLGRPLFERLNRAMKLTEAGEQLALPLSELFLEMSDLVEAARAQRPPRLEVSALPSFAAKWLAPRAARFQSAHADCRIRIAGSDQLVDFSRQKVDIGIRYGSGDYPGLFVERLAAVSAFPVCSPEFAVRAHGHDLWKLPLIHDESSLRAAGLPTWNAWFVANDIDLRKSPRRALVFESVHMALDAAAAGQGVALGLTPLVNDDLEAGRLVRLSRRSLKSAYSFWFVCRMERAREANIRAFRSWLHEELWRPAAKLNAAMKGAGRRNGATGRSRR